MPQKHTPKSTSNLSKKTIAKISMTKMPNTWTLETKSLSLKSILIEIWAKKHHVKSLITHLVHQIWPVHLRTPQDAAQPDHHPSHLQEAVVQEEQVSQLSKSKLMELSKTVKLSSKSYQNAKNKIMRQKLWVQF